MSGRSPKVHINRPTALRKRVVPRASRRGESSGLDQDPVSAGSDRARQPRMSVVESVPSH
eukprot:6681222-Heterocapsa_arctica.AAC.1